MDGERRHPSRIVDLDRQACAFIENLMEEGDI